MPDLIFRETEGMRQRLEQHDATARNSILRSVISSPFVLRRPNSRINAIGRNRKRQVRWRFSLLGTVNLTMTPELQSEVSESDSPVLLQDR